MGHKLPVLITTACNLPQVEQHGAGLSCAAEIRSISEALTKLAAMDDAQLARMGMRGYRLVRNKFTWQSAARKTLLMYKWLMGLEPRPRFIALPQEC